MKCPVCGHPESKVLDSRPANEGTSIRRRRECLNCQKRFTTFETIENVTFMVVKKDKTRESFDRMKLLNGLVRACEKRPVTMQQLENAVSDIEQTLQATMKNEIASSEIGELVMDKLKSLDEVAYVRFASVYRQFKDITTFRDELNKLLDKQYWRKVFLRTIRLDSARQIKQKNTGGEIKKSCRRCLVLFLFGYGYKIFIQ